MDTIELLRQMRQELLDFIDDIMIACPEEKDLIWFHIFVKNQVPMTDVARYITSNIVPLEQKVDSKDADFFKKNAVLFEKLGNFETEINRFKNLWDLNNNPDDREMVWKWLKRFVELGKQYQVLTAQNQQQK